MRNEEVIEAPVDQTTITKRYTEEVLSFIEANRHTPFFVYLPHAMVHNPVHASEAFSGKSANGGYGDAVEELDWSTGQILDYLKENNLSKNTLVLFTSDNGAASRWGGSNQPLSGWKGSTMEGGMRVPGIFWWPGHVPPGSTAGAMATTMDLLPTFSKLAGATVPAGRIIDGYDIMPILRGEEARSPYEVFFYYQLEQLQAVRSGQWKLHLPLDSTYKSIHQATWQPGRALGLYDLASDLTESHDLAALHPEIVESLLKFAEQGRYDLGDLHRAGKNMRSAGHVDVPKPMLMN
jgi:arylsulfatase A-like enzyme